MPQINGTVPPINGTVDVHLSMDFIIFSGVWLGTALVVIFILVLSTRSCKPASEKDYGYQELATTDQDQKTSHNQ